MYCTVNGALSRKERAQQRTPAFFDTVKMGAFTRFFDALRSRCTASGTRAEGASK
jgi:hypothetical protein